MQPRQNFSLPSLSSVARGYRRFISTVANELPSIVTRILMAQAIAKPITQQITFNCPSPAAVQNDLTEFFNGWYPMPGCYSYNYGAFLDYQVDRNLLDELYGYLQFQPTPKECNTQPKAVIASSNPTMSFINLNASNPYMPGHNFSLVACVYDIKSANMPINNTCLFEAGGSAYDDCLLVPISNTQWQFGATIFDGQCEVSQSTARCDIVKTPDFFADTWISNDPYLRFDYSNVNNTIVFVTDVGFVNSTNGNTFCRVQVNGNATDFLASNQTLMSVEYDGKNDATLLQKTPECQTLFNEWTPSNWAPYLVFPDYPWQALTIVNANQMSFETYDVNRKALNVTLNRENPLAVSSSSSTGAAHHASSSSSTAVAGKSLSSSSSITGLLKSLSGKSSTAHRASSSTAHHSFSSSSSSTGINAAADNASSSSGIKTEYVVAAAMGGLAGLGILGVFCCYKRKKNQHQEDLRQALSVKTTLSGNL